MRVMQFNFNDDGIISTKMLITREFESLEAINDNFTAETNTLRFEKCAYTIVEDSDNENVTAETFTKSLMWIRDNGYTHKGVAFMGMLLMTSADANSKTYLEIFVPLE